uniref:ATP-dependent DNA helicase n=1 Tax=Ananas comosus var. bracteatus TaxID=296719 RepID=A0A6V7PRR3_ANACO|nr:unnamed protein product [Ananas comosus var. bracteatus]
MLKVTASASFLKLPNHIPLLALLPFHRTILLLLLSQSRISLTRSITSLNSSTFATIAFLMVERSNPNPGPRIPPLQNLPAKLRRRLHVPDLREIGPDLLHDLELRDRERPRKVIVFCGDFKRVLPVVRKGSRAEIVNNCLVKSYLWPLMERLQLEENMRAKNDPNYCDFLLRVGDGIEHYVSDNMIEIPNEMLIPFDNIESSK